MGWILLPIGLGACAVLQGALNRKIADAWGLVPAVLFNTFVFLIAALGLWLAVRFAPERFPAFFRGRFDAGSIAWWYVLPGLFGFALVAGLPWAIAKVGAAEAFVGLVAAQMVVSVLWDAKVEGIPLGTPRVLGAVLAVVAAFLVTRR